MTGPMTSNACEQNDWCRNTTSCVIAWGIPVSDQQAFECDGCAGGVARRLQDATSVVIFEWNGMVDVEPGV